MKTFNPLSKASAIAAALTLTAASTAVAEKSVSEADKAAFEQAIETKIETSAQNAWKEGKLESAYLFNRHLNNFAIDVRVQGSTALLSGDVESAVDKELAEQVALSVDGIDRVKNELAVVPGSKDIQSMPDEDRDFSERVEDATLTAEVKMKLLANSETSGMAINVDTRDRNVTLKGAVDSAAEKSLAGQIAENVEGVRSVDNDLTVEKEEQS